MQGVELGHLPKPFPLEVKEDWKCSCWTTQESVDWKMARVGQDAFMHQDSQVFAEVQEDTQTWWAHC